MAVFLQVITLFLLIFCGFFSAKGKLVDENGISTLNKIVLYFALPALTLYGLQKDASPELIHDLILVFFISLAIMILSGLIAYFLYRSEPNERRSVLTNLSMLSNSAYMGYPVVIATLGEDMLIYAVVFVGAFNLMCWTFGSFFFGGISAIQPKKLLTNPSLIAVIVGLVLFLTGWRLPGFINDALSMMGNVTTPLAMFVIGARLIDLRFAHLQDWKLLLACALRLIRARPLGDIGFVVVAGKEPAFAHGGNLLCRGDIIKTASKTINDGSGNRRGGRGNRKAPSARLQARNPCLRQQQHQRQRQNRECC